MAVPSNAWVCGCSFAGIAGSNPIREVDLCLLCYMLSGRGLFDWLSTRPEKSYRVWCVGV